MAMPDVVKLFKKNGRTGYNIFHEIAREGTLTILQRIRDNVDEEIDDLLRELDDQGRTCVHIAAQEQRGQRAIALIQIFVTLGGDIRGTDNIGYTALHYAVYNNDISLATWLIEQPGINLEVRNQEGLTPHDMACVQALDYMAFLREVHGAVNPELSEIDDSDDDDESDGRRSG